VQIFCYQNGLDRDSAKTDAKGEQFVGLPNSRAGSRRMAVRVCVECWSFQNRSEVPVNNDGEGLDL